MLIRTGDAMELLAIRDALLIGIQALLWMGLAGILSLVAITALRMIPDRR